MPYTKLMDTNDPMTPLSPAAQAVRDAALATYDKSIPKDESLWALDRASVVAALRAVADQAKGNPPDMKDELSVMYSCGWDDCAKQILTIAAELEGAN